MVDDLLPMLYVGFVLAPVTSIIVKLLHHVPLKVLVEGAVPAVYGRKNGYGDDGVAVVVSPRLMATRAAAYRRRLPRLEDCLQA